MTWVWVGLGFAGMTWEGAGVTWVRVGLAFMGVTWVRE